MHAIYILLFYSPLKYHSLNARTCGYKILGIGKIDIVKVTDYNENGMKTQFCFHREKCGKIAVS